MHDHQPVELAVWRQFLVEHADGEPFDGRVVDVVPFGAFVDLGHGVHGLVHDSTYETAPETGSTVRVRILAMDPVHRRVSLTQV